MGFILIYLWLIRNYDDGKSDWNIYVFSHHVGPTSRREIPAGFRWISMATSKDNTARHGRAIASLTEQQQRAATLGEDHIDVEIHRFPQEQSTNDIKRLVIIIVYYIYIYLYTRMYNCIIYIMSHKYVSLYILQWWVPWAMCGPQVQRKPWTQWSGPWGDKGEEIILGKP